jgi:hypothetical protein
MRKICKFAAFGLLPLLGLIWAVGCTTSPTGGGDGGTTVPQFQLEISIEPAAVHPDTGGIVSCWLTSSGNPVDGKYLTFYAASQDSSTSSITSATYSLSTEPTGTQWPVYYYPNDYTGDIDTIFAAAYHDEQSEVVIAGDTLTITIIHP